MSKTNEVDVSGLMVGNYLMYDGEMVRVVMIDPRHKLGDIKGSITFPDKEHPGEIITRWAYKFQPIPLTPEILGKCGFDIDVDANEYTFYEGCEFSIGKASISEGVQYWRLYQCDIDGARQFKYLQI